MFQTTLFAKNGAVFSPCRTWRYALSRVWLPERPVVMFVGLNPSTADETVDDPTVTRCIRYARDWGYGGVIVTNLFAFRATDPKQMKKAADPVGPENDHWLLKTEKQVARVIFAWGNHGAYKSRDKQVLDLFKHVQAGCLGFTAQGQPKHPLFLRKDTAMVKYDNPEKGARAGK